MRSIKWLERLTMTTFTNRVMIVLAASLLDRKQIAVAFIATAEEMEDLTKSESLPVHIANVAIVNKVLGEQFEAILHLKGRLNARKAEKEERDDQDDIDADLEQAAENMAKLVKVMREAFEG